MWIKHHAHWLLPRLSRLPPRQLLPCRSIQHGPRSSKTKHQEERAATSGAQSSRWGAQSRCYAFEWTVSRDASRHQGTTGIPLFKPSIEDLETFGATHLEHLIDGVNESWIGSIPVEGPKPQPDYSVGFRRSAFTDKQLKKIDPLIGSVYETSYFVATYRMYFPFLTGEVKCGAAALDIADRQNAHSMTVAVRSVVELYRAVKREKELHREILAFSSSHDHSSVRIYGHYAVIEGETITFYRHSIHKFDFTALDGRDKWTAYKFTKNIYDMWMPLHLKRICSAIDDLPADIDFGLSRSASIPQSEPRNSPQSNASMLGIDDSQSGLVGSQEVTPTTSFSQPASKKPRH
jgi:hypothetical protein